MTAGEKQKQREEERERKVHTIAEIAYLFDLADAQWDGRHDN